MVGSVQYWALADKTLDAFYKLCNTQIIDPSLCLLWYEFVMLFSFNFFDVGGLNSKKMFVAKQSIELLLKYSILRYNKLLGYFKYYYILVML